MTKSGNFDAGELTKRTRKRHELSGLLKDNLEKDRAAWPACRSIVRNMLLHSREGSGEHRPADINAIVEESLNLAYHGARAEKQGFNITLERSFDRRGEARIFIPRTSPGCF